MAKEEKKDVVKVEETTGKTVSTNLFGAKDDENFLAKTLGQNFSQVKKTLVEYKVEDIKREMKREIQDKIIDLRRTARKPQDDLTKIIDVRETEDDGSIYNLSGQKVERPNKKGLYIRGGKKVVIK